MKKLLLLFLIAGFGLQSLKSQTNLPANETFTPDEERQILNQLYELHRARITIADLTEYIQRDAEIDGRERAAAANALELEREATRITGMERDLAREKATMYETLYRSVTRGPSFGCRVVRVVTIGLYRCR